MKKKAKRGLLISVMIAVVASLSACGSGSSKSARSDAGAYEADYAVTTNKVAYDDAYVADYYDEAAEEAAYDSGSGSSSVEVVDTSRKLIKNVDMSVETSDLDEVVANINARIRQYNGYVENSYIDNNAGSRYNKNAQMTVRIPAAHLDEFVNNVGEATNVLSKSESVSDVTLQYVDIEARKSSLETEQQRLLELMERAETVEDILYIEDRLTDIRYQLESAVRQLKSYDNQVDYSTVYITIMEVKEYTPVVERTRWQIICEDFKDSVLDAIDSFLDFLVGLIMALPFLIIWGLFFGIIAFIIVKIAKKRKRKAMELLSKKQQNGTAGYFYPDPMAPKATVNNPEPQSVAISDNDKKDDASLTENNDESESKEDVE